ncbi:MAG TPA: glycosyltransferase [Rhizomicrobium sp.]|jgi:spore maturation protein CgeB|nr:glycosyltransferase [Rhizomicrobium sp.]
MKLVVFGLTISSSWGNGHATLWRGLARALAEKGHHLVFFERDVSWYAGARDYWQIPGGELVLYRDWQDIEARAASEIEDCDAAIVTSYCPDAILAGERIFETAPVSVFYDLDTPITLGRLGRGEGVPYIGARGLADYDLVLSFTGGGALDALRRDLSARRIAPLYGHVDPALHRPAAPNKNYRADLSYLGTWAADRQECLEHLFVEAARARPEQRFVIAGAQYPKEFPWSSNIWFVRHLPPGEHPAFFVSSRLTLNITRRDMAAMGWCPSGRLFEAAACGCPIVTDMWEGLDSFFEPGHEVLTAENTDHVLAALDRGSEELGRIADRARERVIAEHTSAHRADELLSLLNESRHRGADAHDVLSMEA